MSLIMKHCWDEICAYHLPNVLYNYLSPQKELLCRMRFAHITYPMCYIIIKETKNISSSFFYRNIVSHSLLDCQISAMTFQLNMISCEYILTNLYIVHEALHIKSKFLQSITYLTFIDILSRSEEKYFIKIIFVSVWTIINLIFSYQRINQFCTTVIISSNLIQRFEFWKNL